MQCHRQLITHAHCSLMSKGMLRMQLSCRRSHLAQRQALVPAVELALHALDGHHLPRLPVGSLEHAAVGAVAQLRGDAVALHGGRWAGGADRRRGAAEGGPGWAGRGPPRCSSRCCGALGRAARRAECAEGAAVQSQGAGGCGGDGRQCWIDGSVARPRNWRGRAGLVLPAAISLMSCMAPHLLACPAARRIVAGCMHPSTAWGSPGGQAPPNTASSRHLSGSPCGFGGGL